MATLNPNKIRTLLALRAAPMDSSQLHERFGVSHEVTKLVKMGQANFHSGYYKLTEAGRDACPNRRDVLVKAPRVHKGIDSKAKTAANRAIRKRNNASEVSLSAAMIELMLDRGVVPGKDICRQFDISSPHASLMRYIKSGQVIKNYIQGTRFVSFELSAEFRAHLMLAKAVREEHQEALCA